VKFLDCPLKYIGQTNKIFHTGYKEHKQANRNNNTNSGSASHILNTGHTYGIITDVIDIIRTYKNI
jgi:hypothetical protein